MITYNDKIKELIKNNPEIVEEVNKGLLVFKDTVFEGLVEPYLLFDGTDDGPIMYINYYPETIDFKPPHFKCRYRVMNLFKRHKPYFESLLKQANRSIVVETLR